jgi:hypothetical protein
VGRYKWYQSHCPAWDGGSVHKPIRITSRHSLGRQEWGDPWGSPTGMLDPERGWLWRLTLLGNVDVLICINVPFLTQHVLKPWWPWTYHNSTIKHASTRIVLGCVTSWEVWFEEAKSRQYCFIRSKSLQVLTRSQGDNPVKKTRKQVSRISPIEPRRQPYKENKEEWGVGLTLRFFSFSASRTPR